MKASVILAGLILMFHVTRAQDSLRSCELGSTILTVNSFNSTNYFAPDRPAVEFINGLFFRFNKKRLGFRIHASYSESAASYASPPDWSDQESGDIINKDLRIGAGIQFTLIKQKEWLYTLVDLSYINLFSTGHVFGAVNGTDDKFAATANGAETFLGLGFKIKIVKSIYISPELGYFASFKNTKSTSTSVITGQVTTANYINFSASAAIRFHLTVKF